MEVSYIQQAILQVGLALWLPLAARPWEVPEATPPLAPLTMLLPVQDTTKKAPPRQSFPPRTPELKTPFLLFARPSIGSPLGRFGGLSMQSTPFEHLDLKSLDSLGGLHPGLKTYLLRELVIQGALRDERLRFSLDRNIWGDRFHFERPSELESALRRNQQMFGTTNNPLRPPPPPNQVNLLELVSAVSNLLRALGVQ